FGTFAIDVTEVRLFLDRAGEKPGHASPVVGAWTVRLKVQDEERHYSLTLEPDGTLMWEYATTQHAGAYTFQQGSLTLTVPGLNIREQRSAITWQDGDRFTFERGGLVNAATRR